MTSVAGCQLFGEPTAKDSIVLQHILKKKRFQVFCHCLDGEAAQLANLIGRSWTAVPGGDAPGRQTIMRGMGVAPRNHSADVDNVSAASPCT